MFNSIWRADQRTKFQVRLNIENYVLLKLLFK